MEKKKATRNSKDKSISLSSLGIKATIKLVPADEVIIDPNNTIDHYDTDESIQELADRITANHGAYQPIVLNYTNGTYQLLSGKRTFRAVVECLRLQSFLALVYEDFSGLVACLSSGNPPPTPDRHCAADRLKQYIECERTVRLKKARGEYKGGIQKGIAFLMGVSTRQVRRYRDAVKAVGIDNIDMITNVSEAAKMAFQ